MQIMEVDHCRLIGPAAQGWDCTERNAIAITLIERRSTIRAEEPVPGNPPP